MSAAITAGIEACHGDHASIKDMEQALRNAMDRHIAPLTAPSRLVEKNRGEFVDMASTDD